MRLSHRNDKEDNAVVLNNGFIKFFSAITVVQDNSFTILHKAIVTILNNDILKRFIIIKIKLKQQ